MTYVKLTEQIDTHDLSRGRGSLAEALRAVSARVLVMGIDSDVLYPLTEQEELVDALNRSRDAGPSAESDTPPVARSNGHTLSTISRRDEETYGGNGSEATISPEGQHQGSGRDMAQLRVIQSTEGHDGFLLEQDQVGRYITSFLNTLSSS